MCSSIDAINAYQKKNSINEESDYIPEEKKKIFGGFVLGKHIPFLMQISRNYLNIFSTNNDIPVAFVLVKSYLAYFQEN